MRGGSNALTDGDRYFSGDVGGDEVATPTGVPKETGTGTVSKPGAERIVRLKSERHMVKMEEISKMERVNLKNRWIN